MATAAKIGIGSAINRVDGVEKVTGTARYAAEHPVENLLYGYIVEAAIAKVSEEPPSDDDVRQVAARLAAAGWPLTGFHEHN